MKRGKYLKPHESEALYRRITEDGLTVAQLARETGRDASALYRLFNRRFGFTAGHATGYRWAPTFTAPEDPLMIGYLAGLFDGEGALSYTKGGRWVVRITMTDEGVIRGRLHALGGTLSHAVNKPPRKPTWTWQMARRSDVETFLRAVRPMLIVKAAKADEALASLSTPPS